MCRGANERTGEEYTWVLLAPCPVKINTLYTFSFLLHTIKGEREREKRVTAIEKR